MTRRDRSGTRGVRPLRRRPKQLTEPPTLFQPSGSGGGTVLSSGDRRRSGTGASRAGGTAPGTTDEAADVVALADLTAQSDADRLTRARARQIARRLSVPRPPRDQRRRGVGELASLSWNGGSDELDLERTLEAVAGIAHPEATDLVVRERVRQRRSVVLVVDVSGSMKGERVRTAAATVGALAGELARDWLAVVAFWSDAAVLAALAEPATPSTLLDRLLRIPARGLTNVGFGLAVAHGELARSAARRHTAVLLTDAVHNAGPDPREPARRFGELHVLLETDGEHDLPLARDLARLGRGRLAAVRTHRDVAPALNRFLGR